MKPKYLITAIIAGSQVALAAQGGDAVADNSSSQVEIEALKKEIQALEQKVEGLEERQQNQTNAAAPAQVEALDQKVRILEREHENDQEAAVAFAKTQPKLSVGANGVSISSADSNFV